MPTAPPIVGNMVPGTTVGHHPFGSVWRHRSEMLAPPSASITPELASKLTMRRIPRLSIASCPLLSEASP